MKSARHNSISAPRLSWSAPLRPLSENQKPCRERPRRATRHSFSHTAIRMMWSVGSEQRRTFQRGNLKPPLEKRGDNLYNERRRSVCCCAGGVAPAQVEGVFRIPSLPLFSFPEMSITDRARKNNDFVEKLHKLEEAPHFGEPLLILCSFLRSSRKTRLKARLSPKLRPYKGFPHGYDMPCAASARPFQRAARHKTPHRHV